MKIETSRLIIRDLQKFDLHPLPRLVRPEVTVYLSGPRDFEWVVNALAEDLPAGQETYDLRPVIEKATGQIMGHCGYLEKEVEGRPEIELNYILARLPGAKAMPPRPRRLFAIMRFGSSSSTA